MELDLEVDFQTILAQRKPCFETCELCIKCIQSILRIYIYIKREDVAIA